MMILSDALPDGFKLYAADGSALVIPPGGAVDTLPAWARADLAAAGLLVDDSPAAQAAGED